MSAKLPPIILESGDRLSREEFHRRYCLRPDIHKAELVQGVVYVASPVRFKAHGEPHGSIMGWLFVYQSQTAGVRVGDNATVLLDPDTEVQPDGCLFYDPPPVTGAARITDADYIEGAPQLVVEVAASSASYDLHDKLRAYERAGVQEYLVWRTVDGALDCFRLHAGAFQRLEPDARGVIESVEFPGLRLHVPKLLSGDVAGVLAELSPSAGEKRILPGLVPPVGRLGLISRAATIEPATTPAPATPARSCGPRHPS